MPILTLLIAVPALTAVAIAVTPAENRAGVRATALVGTLVSLALTVVLLLRFTAGEAGFQLAESAEWVPAWGISYRVAVDGISLLLVALTGLFMPLVVLASWEHLDRAKGFFASLMVLQASLVGVFTALDLILFYVFFEVMLVPMYALIGIWGSGNRRYAAIKFFLYTLVGTW